MTRVSGEKLAELREAEPEVYEELLELRNICAQAWNAVASRSMPKRFRGKTYALAESLLLKSVADDGPRRNQVEIELGRMLAEGWRNCHSS